MFLILKNQTIWLKTYRRIKDSFKGHLLFLVYEPFIGRSSSLEKDIEGLKRTEKFEVENF